jgi:hypothetical protein
MKQCTPLTCKETFAFKVNGKGKAITFKQGQRFWVTNTEIDQKNRNVVNIARDGKSMGQGYDFTAEQVKAYFTE